MVMEMYQLFILHPSPPIQKKKEKKMSNEKKRKITSKVDLKKQIISLINDFDGPPKKKKKKDNVVVVVDDDGEKINVDNPLDNHCCSISGGIFVYPCTLRCGHSYESMSVYKLINDKDGTFKCPLCKKKYDSVDAIISENVFISSEIDRYYPGYRDKEILDAPDDYCRLDKCMRSNVYNGSRALDDINIRKKIVARKWYDKVTPFILEMVENGWVRFF